MAKVPFLSVEDGVLVDVLLNCLAFRTQKFADPL